ncbi:helix-turn-helix domain-containing protein [Streptomyces sp. B21-079]|uniref:helix-turn-helix domain-containing protein n=1 Tax=Streptomyces sp. B21-079 TaxID=3039409 RepID=UPI002FF26AB8
MRRLLAEAGLEISAGKMSALWSATVAPVSVRLDDVEVLCRVLGCDAAGLLVLDTPAGWYVGRRGTGRRPCGSGGGQGTWRRRCGAAVTAAGVGGPRPKGRPCLKGWGRPGSCARRPYRPAGCLRPGRRAGPHTPRRGGAAGLLRPAFFTW